MLSKIQTIMKNDASILEIFRLDAIMTATVDISKSSLEITDRNKLRGKVEDIIEAWLEEPHYAAIKLSEIDKTTKMQSEKKET